jgi:hypothetical protein
VVQAGFELSAPQSVLCGKLSADLARYSHQNKAAVLERILSPGIRLVFLSLRSASSEHLRVVQVLTTAPFADVFEKWEQPGQAVLGTAPFPAEKKERGRFLGALCGWQLDNHFSDTILTNRRLSLDDDRNSQIEFGGDRPAGAHRGEKLPMRERG